jgi:hypothetical protein
VIVFSRAKRRVIVQRFAAGETNTALLFYDLRFLRWR